MSISDELMWRYYELLTDKKMAEIEQMKSGMHPMDAKKHLAAQIVKDFHGEQAAQQAAENWARQFQKDEVPENVEEVKVKLVDVGFSHADEFGGGVMNAPEGYKVRLDKLLFRTGLCSSVSEGARKIKERAVRTGREGAIETSTFLYLDSVPFSLVLRVGRKVKRAVIQ
jgi:tyrosyl-tRNA synthetase